MLASNEAGDVDLRITPMAGKTLSYGNETTLIGIEYEASFNLTKIGQALLDNDIKLNRYTPRIEYSVNTSVIIGSEAYFSQANLALIDSQKEIELEIGHSWNFPSISTGECFIAASLARQLHAREGDIVTLALDYLTLIRLFPVMNDAFRNGILASQPPRDIEKFRAAIEYMFGFKMELKIARIVEDWMVIEKGLRKDEAIFIEYDSFWRLFVENLPPAMFDIFSREMWDAHDMREYAAQVLFSMPYPRHSHYLSLSIEQLKKELSAWASDVAWRLGFDTLKMEMPAIESYASYSFIGMMLGMVSLLLIAVLTGISLLLIYSLLQISVDQRGFELGVLRMVGFQRIGVVGLIIVQVLLYTVPAWLLGEALGIGVNYLLIFILIDATGHPLDSSLPPLSIILSTLIAFGIPLLASFFPVRSILKELSSNLSGSAQAKHGSKKAPVKVEIERTSKVPLAWNLLMSGVVLFVLGGSVYIMFPLALLSADFTLLMILFFIIIFAVLIAFIIFSLNFEYPVEMALSFSLLCLESRVVRHLSLTVLSAHRVRNRKTTLLFSVALSFIVFVNIIAVVLVALLKTIIFMDEGADIVVYANPWGKSPESNGISETNYDPQVRYFYHPEELEEIVQ